MILREQRKIFSGSWVDLGIIVREQGSTYPLSRGGGGGVREGLDIAKSGTYERILNRSKSRMALYFASKHFSTRIAILYFLLQLYVVW